MKKYYLITAVVSLAMLLLFGTAFSVWSPKTEAAVLKVGFIYENDESSPSTYNFTLAQSAVEKEFGDLIQTYTIKNVLETETEEPLRDLVRRGCKIIFISSYSRQVISIAEEYPSVQFCQISYANNSGKALPVNYHTFNGRVFEGQYISGIAAGLGLQQQISQGVLTDYDARIGFIAPGRTSDVISSFTAFLLGIRSVVPNATMHVLYTGVNTSSSLERRCTETLLEEGCTVIAQYTSTTAPAVACEEASESRPVIHVGYNQSMIDVAPNTSIISSRINWTSYISKAIQAVLDEVPIESGITGIINGTDVSAGFREGGIEMLDLNAHIAADGTQASLDKAIDSITKGTLSIFKGDYTGTDPTNPGDRIDLNQGYVENASSSFPTFHYILDDIVIQ